jgi:hypothetical protein
LRTGTAFGRFSLLLFTARANAVLSKQASIQHPQLTRRYERDLSTEIDRAAQSGRFQLLRGHVHLSFTRRRIGSTTLSAVSAGH